MKTLKNIIKYYLAILIVIFSITYWSYSINEEFFMLIPILLLPVCQVQCFFLMPIVKYVLKHSKLRGVDISNFRKIVRIWRFIETLMTAFLLTIAILFEKVLLTEIIYFIYAGYSVFFILYYFWFKFNYEAKLQCVDLKDVSISQLYIEMESTI
jgi:hypothetical protein